MRLPCGRSIHKWTAKAKAEVEQGNAEIVIGLLPARPDTTYWHRDIAGSASVLFLRGRLRFGNAEQVAPFPSCLVVWGGSDEVITAIQAALPDAWLSQCSTHGRLPLMIAFSVESQAGDLSVSTQLIQLKPTGVQPPQ